MISAGFVSQGIYDNWQLVIGDTSWTYNHTNQPPWQMTLFPQWPRRLPDVRFQTARRFVFWQHVGPLPGGELRKGREQVRFKLSKRYTIYHHIINTWLNYCTIRKPRAMGIISRDEASFRELEHHGFNLAVSSKVIGKGWQLYEAMHLRGESGNMTIVLHQEISNMIF